MKSKRKQTKEEKAQLKLEKLYEHVMELPQDCGGNFRRFQKKVKQNVELLIDDKNYKLAEKFLEGV